MKKRIKIIILLILVLIVINLCKYVLAVGDICILKLDTQYNNVQPGKTIEIVLNASNISDEGIAAISGIIDYDENVFSDIQYEACNNWELPTVLENYVLTNNYEGTKVSQSIFKIKLKIKDNAKGGKYKITLKDIEVASDNSHFELEDIYININVEGVRL